MRRICVDTSAYSQFKRNEDRAVDAIRYAREVLVPVIVLGELRAGFRGGARRGENERALAQFLSQPVVRVLDIDDMAAEIYADIVSDLRAAGTPVPTNDVWIAAVAAREGALVLTSDGHFVQIRRVGSHILPVA